MALAKKVMLYLKLVGSSTCWNGAIKKTKWQMLEHRGVQSVWICQPPYFVELLKDNKFLIIGNTGPMMLHVWPAAPVRVGKHTWWVHGPGDVTSIEKEALLALDEWMVVPCRVTSPAELYIMNNHSAMYSIPNWPLLQTGKGYLYP